MAKDPLEVEVDQLETEVAPLLREPGDQRSRPSEASIPLRRKVESGQEVFVPQTNYRFSYRQPERFSAEETRRRRFEGVLQEARRDNLRSSPSVSGSIKSQYAKQRSEASASDRRRFDPRARGAAGDFLINPRSVFGTEAYTYVSEGLRRHFSSPFMAIPCVQRVVRREVMFAKRKAGRGYKVPKVRSLLSNIGC